MDMLKSRDAKATSVSAILLLREIIPLFGYVPFGIVKLQKNGIQNYYWPNVVS